MYYSDGRRAGEIKGLQYLQEAKDQRTYGAACC